MGISYVAFEERDFIHLLQVENGLGTSYTMAEEEVQLTEKVPERRNLKTIHFIFKAYG